MNNNIEHQSKEFEVFGLKIENLSVYYGLFLILWGIVISLIGSNSLLLAYLRY